MKKGNLELALKLSVPVFDQASFAKFQTESGAFKDGDPLFNRDGIVSQPPLIKPTDEQLSLADIDIIKVVGKENGGVVQLVQHKRTSQFFVLKIFPMNIANSEECKQLQKELKINEAAQCPYVVVCYQSFYHIGVISFILEYMDGGSLADLLKKVTTIPEPYLASICKQVLKGLMYLHDERHIIHRDLKPSNLLINHGGEVKITDFGASEIMESTSVQEDTFIGTYNYMSKDPRDRLSAQELMNSPFISMYEDLDVDLSAYFSNAGSPLATL